MSLLLLLLTGVMANGHHNLHSDRITFFLYFYFYAAAVLQNNFPRQIRYSYSFNIQDGCCMRFHSTTNYKNENNIKRFYIENSPCMY